MRIWCIKIGIVLVVHIHSPWRNIFKNKIAKLTMYSNIITTQKANTKLSVRKNGPPTNVKLGLGTMEEFKHPLLTGHTRRAPIPEIRYTGLLVWKRQSNKEYETSQSAYWPVIICNRKEGHHSDRRNIKILTFKKTHYNHATVVLLVSKNDYAKKTLFNTIVFVHK
jgi:hypothetical protein